MRVIHYVTEAHLLFQEMLPLLVYIQVLPIKFYNNDITKFFFLMLPEKVISA